MTIVKSYWISFLWVTAGVREVGGRGGEGGESEGERGERMREAVRKREGERERV